jgi:F-type H+-transporting ATPase subunit gamma
VQGTAKITKAMELVAASKMRRAQLMALQGRPYAERITWVLADLAETVQEGDSEALHPLLERRDIASTGILLVSPARGLCGGLPGSLNRRCASLILELGTQVELITVGKKGRDFFRRTATPIRAEFSELSDYPEYTEIIPIARVIIDDYLSGAVDQVFIVYPYFINTMSQEPRVKQLLPVEPPQEKATLAVDYIYEPGRAAVLQELLPRFIETQIYAAVLDGVASEQSARMVAMRNATDAANDMIQELTLTYNKARQEQITKELLDIVGGVEGLKA